MKEDVSSCFLKSHYPFDKPFNFLSSIVFLFLYGKIKNFKYFASKFPLPAGLSASK